MTVLGLIQAFCRRTGLPIPTAVIGTAESSALQLLELLNEVSEDLMEHAWEQLTEEATFTTVAGRDQGAITTLAPKGFKWVLNDTIFDRTLRLPIYGPLTAPQWQALKALPTSGPQYRYRIQGGRLLFDPEAVSGDTCAFEYASSWCVLAVDGITRREYPSADTDTYLLPHTLFQAGLRWKWKYEKGLDYAEDFRRYEGLKANALGRNGTKGKLYLDEAAPMAAPGIFVPSNNWNLP